MSGLAIADDFALPLDAITETFAMLAMRGSGKTYASAVMAEEFLKNGMPLCVLDPVGVWWGLRANSAGDGPGLPVVVFGGDHGDIELYHTAGAVMADLVVSARERCIIDLSLFSKTQQRHFVTDFAVALYRRNRDPLHVILDEADEFIPQRVTSGTAPMVGAFEDIVRRGRARGIGITMITQRPAVINKDVLSQVGTLFALRLSLTSDRKAIFDWIAAHDLNENLDQLKSTIASLPIGDAWIWSPGWLRDFRRIHIRRRETFDSSATPKYGEVRITPETLAPVDIEAVREWLGQHLEETKAEDAPALKKRIRELESQLSAERAKPPAVEVRTFFPELLQVQIAEQCEEIEIATKSIYALIESAAESARAKPTIQPAATQERTPPAARPRNITPIRAETTYPQSGSTPIADGLRSGQNRILAALRRFPDCGLDTRQLAYQADVKSGSGTWNNYMGDLKRKDLIESSDGRWYAATNTGAGDEAVERIESWYEKLRAGEVRLLDALVVAFPNAVTTAQLSHAASIAAGSGTWNNYVGTLRRLGLVGSIGAGSYVAIDSPWFPIGSTIRIARSK